MTKGLYLWINIGTILIPFIFSFHPKLKFNKNFGSFIKANLIVAFIFILWDIIYTKLGVWGFNEKYLIGFNIFNLPIEEVIFFICIPFSSLFTYHCLNLFLKFKWNEMFEKTFIVSVSSIILIIGIIYIDRYYTASVFLSLPFVLILSKFVFRIDYLLKFLISYLVLLIPFFVVNGLLTGSLLDQPVVWYNDNENLGLRILTIPIDDFFYSFELLFLNVILYEYFLKNDGSTVIS